MTADPQQQLIYQWEESFKDWDRCTLTVKECRAYVSTACAYYQMPPPIVRGHMGRAVTFFQAHESAQAAFVESGAKSTVSFRPDGRNPAIALHEASHAIMSMWLPWDLPAHGEEFMGVYMWLLRKAKVAPRIALEASASAKGISWINLTPGAMLRLARTYGTN